MLKGIGKLFCNGLELRGIRREARKKALRHFRSRFQHSDEVFLSLIFAVYYIRCGLAARAIAQSSEKAAVVKHLEARAHAVIARGECVDYRVGSVNVRKESIKAVVIDASAIIAAVQAAEAAALKLKVRNVHKARFIRKGRGKVLHHRSQALVLLAQVSDDDGVIVLGLL